MTNAQLIVRWFEVLGKAMLYAIAICEGEEHELKAYLEAEEKAEKDSEYPSRLLRKSMFARLVSQEVADDFIGDIEPDYLERKVRCGARMAGIWRCSYALWFIIRFSGRRLCSKIEALLDRSISS